jgi:hypothetical protein
MAGTGHRVVSPQEVVDIAPELVVVMNPIYLDEIGSELDRLGVTAEITAV